MESFQYVPEGLVQISPAQWCQTFFILAATLIGSIAILPSKLKGMLMDYGPRNPRAKADQNGDGVQERQRPDDNRNGDDETYLDAVVSWVTSWLQIPHSWFSGFYFLSFALSVFWAVQYLTDGSVIRFIAAHQAVQAPSPGMTLVQVKLAWALMTMQGLRRLYEQLSIMRPSSSKMWIAHWIFGVGFYTFTSVAVWVEGSLAIVNSHVRAKGVRGEFTPKMIIGLVGFMLSWVNQYRCHRYLAGLKKYTLPSQGLFRNIVCAHYTCEVLLYLSLAVAAAPTGQLCNRTLLCAVMAVSVNLGATADRTKQWYIGKFGAEQVAHKWRMIPLLY